MFPTEPRRAWTFPEAVYAVVSLIPSGRVSSYGQVATYVTTPRHARAVGAALRELLPDRAEEIPWHRVINASGRIAVRGDVRRPPVQRSKLESEGVLIEDSGRIDLRRFGWAGPPETWEPPFPFPLPLLTRAQPGGARHGRLHPPSSSHRL